MHNNTSKRQYPNRGQKMTQIQQSKILIIGAFIVVIGIVSFYVLNAPDQRSPGDKIGDAVNELPNGVDKAARQLESRTPGQKLDDAAKDAGRDLRKATNQQK